MPSLQFFCKTKFQTQNHKKSFPYSQLLILIISAAFLIDQSESYAVLTSGDGLTNQDEASQKEELTGSVVPRWCVMQFERESVNRYVITEIQQLPVSFFKIRFLKIKLKKLNLGSQSIIFIIIISSVQISNGITLTTFHEKSGSFPFVPPVRAGGGGGGANGKDPKIVWSISPFLVTVSVRG